MERVGYVSFYCIESKKNYLIKVISMVVKNILFLVYCNQILHLRFILLVYNIK